MTILLEWAYHNIDPTAFTIPGLGMEVKWYGLSYMLTFMVSWALMMRMQAGGYLKVSKDDVTSIIMYAIVGVFLGGRFGYMLFYSDYFYASGPGSFVDDPGKLVGFSNSGFEGLAGLSFHGGLIGVVISLSLFSYVRARRQIRAQLKAGIEIEDQGKAVRMRWKRIAAEVLDAGTYVAPIGVVMVRLANFVNGELYGRVIEDEANAPVWAMRFPTSPEGQSAIREYLQSFEGTAYIRESLGAGAPEQSVVAAKNAAMNLPVDSTMWESVSQQVALRHPSQLYQALCEGLAVVLLVVILRTKLKMRGMIGGVFLMGYALGRIPMEFFRQPDQQFESGQKMSGWGELLASMGMTQGQLLSYAMLFSGAALLFFCGRSKDEGMRRTPEELSLKAEAMTDEEAGMPTKAKAT